MRLAVRGSALPGRYDRHCSPPTATTDKNVNNSALIGGTSSAKAGSVVTSVRITIELSNREFYLLTALLVRPVLHSLKLMFKTLSHGQPKRGKSLPQK